MEATWTRRLAASLCMLGLASSARGDDRPLPSAPGPSTTAAVPAGIPPLAPPPLVNPAPPAGADREKAPATDGPALRAETEARLKRLEAAATDKEVLAADKALKDVLEERLQWLTDWDKAVKLRADAEHPEVTPERQAADGKADEERVKSALDQIARTADRYLPAVFRTSPGQVTDAARDEMKEAIDAAQNELKDGMGKLEKARTDATGSGGGTLATLRAERDQIHQRVATLATRRAEREAALTAAKTPEARDLARERLVNFDWETRVEQERLQGQEARMTLEGKRADLTAQRLQTLEAHVRLAKLTLEAMQTRYQAVADRKERALTRAAEIEEQTAARTDDPMERYRAKRSAELFKLEVEVVKNEIALSTKTWPSLEEQHDQADKAVQDFAGIRKLLDDGRVSQLDALRLNNDFRRIGPERERIVKNELAAAANQLTYYEVALSAVELALVNDARDDRYAYEAMIERLPPERRAEVTAVFEPLEVKHVALLNRRRAALEKLATRAEQTHDEVERRLLSLDEQYGFIRTHIFWVRDQEPIGAATVQEARRDVSRVGRALFRLVLDLGDRSLWGRVSPECAIGLFGVLTLPWPLVRVRRRLQRRRSSTATA